MRAGATTRNHPSWITVLTLTALLVLGLAGVQEAAARGRKVKPLTESMTVSMADFCTHVHVWGGSRTTYPKTTDPSRNCPGSQKPLTLGYFCNHVHEFGGRDTTTPHNSAAKKWCAEHSGDPSTQVPYNVYCCHLHQNASSNTTYPRPRCSNRCAADCTGS